MRALAREIHPELMHTEAVEGVPIAFRSHPLPRPICCKLPGLTLVTQANIETFPESLFGTYRGNRGYELNTLGQNASAVAVDTVKTP
jgi:hypothetical protein